MNLKSCIAAASAAAALALLPMVSHASYRYTWESTNPQAPRNLNFFMEFEESVVNSGSYSLSLDSNDFKSKFPWPDLGLISFGIGFGNNSFLGSFSRESSLQPHVSLDLNLNFGSNREIGGSFSTLGFRLYYPDLDEFPGRRLHGNWF